MVLVGIEWVWVDRAWIGWVCRCFGFGGGGFGHGFGGGD